jgi:DNA-binding transcriptional ArsR family regulator
MEKTVDTYIFKGPWPLPEEVKISTNRILSLRTDHMVLLSILDRSLSVDCCVVHLVRATGLDQGKIQNRLTKLVEFGFVCKTVETGDPAELGRKPKYYYAVTDLGTSALDYMGTIFG